MKIDWGTVLIAIFGTGGIGSGALLGVRTYLRGRATRPSVSEQFRTELAAYKLTASTDLTAYKLATAAELQAVKDELAEEKRERKRENAVMQSQLQAFRDRDGMWLDLWHQQNVALTAAGSTVIQLPDKLRKWPEEFGRSQA